MSSNLSEIHLALLESIAAFDFISLKHLRELMRIIFRVFEIDEEEYDESYVHVLIKEINAEINKDGFTIDTICDQETNQEIHTVIDISDSRLMPNSLQYSRVQSKMLLDIIDRIIEAPVFAYSTAYDIKVLAKALQRKQSDCEDFIRELTETRLLTKTDRGDLVLSTLAILGLGVFLESEYGILSESNPLGKLLKCTKCSRLVTLGKKCSRTGCPSSFHLSCVTADESEVCPQEACSELLRNFAGIGTKISSLPQLSLD